MAVAAVVMALVATACAGGQDEAIVLVDFNHDEFSSIFIYNFPTNITVRPGTTLVFKQTWTGEPHTVTGGMLVTEKLLAGTDWMAFFEGYMKLARSGAGLPDPESESDALVADVAAALDAADDRETAAGVVGAWNRLRDSGVPLPDLDDPGDSTIGDVDAIAVEYEDSVFDTLPEASDQNEDGKMVVHQNAGRPCYLTDGLPPEAIDEPCADQPGSQPVFDGSHSYYSSGIIPFEGPQGNTYRVPLAEDLQPGTYVFYCAVHGFGKRTEVEVVSRAAEADAPEEIARRARDEIEERAKAAQALYRSVVADGELEFDGRTLSGPFAGLHTPDLDHVAINEFIPKRMSVEVNEPVTWKLMGADHSISFDVPPYFPIVEFLPDGEVRLNPLLYPPAGGAPPVPARQRNTVLEVDGGTWDGDGFWSSGLVSAEPYAEYTVRISRPGTYKYACLLHPPMVGTIVVT